MTVQAAPNAKLWSEWDRADAQSTQVVDHSKWQAFLDDYLSESDDGINKLGYAKVAAGPGKNLLDEYIAETTQIDPRILNKDEQLAYWVNLYNALTVHVVLQYPSKGSILRMGKKLFVFGPWDDKVATIAGEKVTLNDIEHRILRPIWKDHRIHYAVNCASIGCPNLATEAYTGANAEQLLAAGEQDYLQHERGISLDGRRVKLSQIFEWYGDDFGANEQAVLRYLAKHHEGLAAVEDLTKLKVKYDYDWKLNSQQPR